MSPQISDLPGGLALAIPLSILILLVMVVLHELGHFFAAKISGVRVLEFGVGWPPRIWSREWRGTRFSLNILPVGAFVRMLGENERPDSPESFSAQPKRSRVFILVAGSAMNFLLAPLLFGAASLINDFESVEITSVASGSPAAAAGLLIGDRIVSVDGERVELMSDVGSLVADRRGVAVRLEIHRDTGVRIINLVPRVTHPADEGPMGVGIRPFMAPAPLPKAVVRGLTRGWDAITLLPRFAGAVRSGATPFEVSGPVGIVDAVGRAAQLGPEVVLILAGLITAQLGLINLLPWPGLDGGRLLLLGVEAVRGRKLPASLEEAINFAGIVLLLVLVVLVTVGDVRRIAGG